MNGAPDILELLLGIGRRVLVRVVLKTKTRKGVGPRDKKRIEEERTFMACFR